MYGLSVQDVQRLAFDIAEQYKLRHPFSKITKRAERDWLKGFLDDFQTFIYEALRAQTCPVRLALIRQS